MASIEAISLFVTIFLNAFCCRNLNGVTMRVKSMLSTEKSQMTWRYLRRRKGQILLALLLFAVLLLWSNVSFTENLVEYSDNCKYPCVGAFCIACPQYTTRAVPVINILSHLKLKKGLKHENQSFSKSNISKPVCKHLNFDLKHDSVKHLFFNMPSLNCSKEELFYVESGIFKLNVSVLKGRKLKKCMYMGIERVTDDFNTYTETVTRAEAPYDMIIAEDFVRIQCQLEKLDKNPDYENSDTENIEAQKSTDEDRHAGVKDVGAKEMKEVESIKRLSQLYEEGISKVKIDKNMNTGHRKLMQDFFVNVDDIEKNDDNNNDDNQNENNQRFDHYRDYYEEDMDSYFDRFEMSEQADFDQLLVQIHPKKSVHERIEKQTQKGLPEQRMNVLILGFDSMSHLAFQRKLPNTYKYLKDELGSVMLDSYNIVGDATTAALIPILTGKAEDELPETRRNRLDSDYVDVYPLIWNDFRDNGYVTMFAEDEPTIGVFNLRLGGFDKQPTDHYMRPFWQALWESSVRTSSPRFCSGNQPNHMYLLNYLKDFYVKYDNVSKFAFVFGSELTHWDNNPGEYMDKDVVDLLTFLKVKGHLDNTLLVVMADHGARYSRVRKTVQGKMEERLPMMSFLFPPWFKQKYSKSYKNLITNSDRLTTPFDVHETLCDVLDLSRTFKPVTQTQKRMSLLRPIPWDRTCASAGIQMHWCTCLKQLDLDTTDGHVKRSVEAVINFINAQTQNLRSLCAELRLKRILNAFLLVPNEKVLMFQKSFDEDNRYANFSGNINIDHSHFQVTIETYPNKGLFEGTIQVNMTAGTYTVMEDVSRIDLYGNQPKCVQDKFPDLRKYCYCMGYNEEKKMDNKPKVKRSNN